MHEVPQGYFDSLPDRIIRKRKSKVRQALAYRLAAAAAIAIGFVWFAIRLPMAPDASFQTEIDQEVEFYINSGYLGAEDVISFSDNPNELLDQIIVEEWSGYDIADEQWPMDDLEY